MFRPFVIGTAALAIAGSSIVFAQQRYFGPRGDGDAASRFQHRHHLSAEDMAAFADARIAALRAGLALLHCIPTIGNSFNLKFLLRRRGFWRRTRKVTDL